MFLCVTFFFISPCVSLAYNSAFSGYVEAGKKTQAEDFEEEEDDSEYTYQRYHVRLKHTFSERFSSVLSSFIYNKDYTLEDSLDNSAHIFETAGDYELHEQAGGFSKINIKLRYKEKRYRNTPSNEYNQMMFAPKLTYARKGIYSVTLSTGLNNYDYVSAGGRDQLKIFSKLTVSRYLVQDGLVLRASYGFETTTQKREDRRKNKNNFMMGFDYRLRNPLVSKITVQVKLGQRDTKDDDERDEDFDYTYRQFYVRTDHRVYRQLTTSLAYRHFKKNYITADLDHSGFYLLNGWRYVILSDKKHDAYCRFTVKHKYVDYTIKSDRNYQKETVELKGTYRKKQDWKASVSLQGNFYSFEESGKDKNRYYLLLSFEKTFPGQALKMSLDAKYKYTDNKGANNTEEESARLAFLYTF
jgi:hypothetical protein